MKLAALFSDHAILQRDRPVPIWGWSSPGDTVTVTFAGQQKTAVAGPNGKWLLYLDPLPASTEPRELTAVTNHQSPITVNNILVGDLWLCSGQSNMQWPVKECRNGAAEVAAADHPQVRLFHVPAKTLLEPDADVDARWQVCAPATVGNFSGVGYFFGRELHRQLGVPIGLIDASRGGTRVAPWTSRAALRTQADTRADVEAFEKWWQTPEAGEIRLHQQRMVRDMQGWVSSLGQPDPGNTGVARGWAAPDFADGDWPTMPIPSGWQPQGHNFSGVFWFRRSVEVPATWAGQEIVLHLGVADKTETTYFNGTQIGATGFETENCWDLPRVYRIPAQLVRAGRNVIAVRVYSNIHQGGLIGPAATMELKHGTASLPLAGPWRYQIEHNFGLTPPPIPTTGPGHADTPGILYANAIALLAPAALRGVIWYQGESNAHAPRLYRDLFPLLINDWRRTFEQAELPFYFVLVANYMAKQTAPVESGWAELREAQLFALRLPRTGMASAIDLGEADDIHPKNKQAVGQRLANVVLAQLHGRPVVAAGPQYKSHTIAGDTVCIEFDNVADGLCAPGLLQGFAVAGADGKFAWATASIEGPTVVVRGHQLPVAVRYAWADNPIGNLSNSAGLPAVPFRTDLD